MFTPLDCAPAPSASSTLMPTLADFLLSRRARLRPSDVGIGVSSVRRRVPGLRREELAELAHISVSYYTRLEQGRVGNVSDEVLLSIAHALRLNDRDKTLLFAVARSRRSLTWEAADDQEEVWPFVRAFVSELESPAWLQNRCGDILAWSRSYHAVLAWRHAYESPEDPMCRPNVVRTHFLDPIHRTLYIDWWHWAAVLVQQLWEEASQRPGDRRMATFVADMCRRSPEFAKLWTAGPPAQPQPDFIHLWHPRIGRVTLRPMVLRMDGGNDLKLSIAARSAPGIEPAIVSSADFPVKDTGSFISCFDQKIDQVQPNQDCGSTAASELSLSNSFDFGHYAYH